MGIRQYPIVTLAALCREGGTEGEVLPMYGGGLAGSVSTARVGLQSKCLEHEPSKALNLGGLCAGK